MYQANTFDSVDRRADLHGQAS